MNEFKITTEFITISQLLKVLDYVTSGGEVKFFLMDNEILLNDQLIFERKKKIKPGDIVTINGTRILMT